MKKKAFLYIILAGIFWGTSGIYVHYLAPLGLSSVQMTCIRGVVAVIALSLYAFLRNRELFKASVKELLLYALGGLSLFMTATCYYTSMQMTSVSTAVVLMYTAPVIVMAYSVAFMGEKLTNLKAVSVICMIAGCALSSGAVGGMKFNFNGVLIGLASGISYSAYNIVTKIQMKKKCNPLTANIYCFLFVAVIALLVSHPFEIVTVATNKPLSILLMVGCGLCTGVIPYFLYTVALKALPAGTVSALGVVEPMAATIFSVVLLGERLNIYSVSGIILILTAVYMLGRAKEE